VAAVSKEALVVKIAVVVRSRDKQLLRLTTRDMQKVEECFFNGHSSYFWIGMIKTSAKI